MKYAQIWPAGQLAPPRAREPTTNGRQLFHFVLIAGGSSPTGFEVDEESSIRR
jgi:hypothetical protein